MQPDVLRKAVMSPLSYSNLFVVLLFILQQIHQAIGHGRLVEPPSRSSMWRFGFKTKPNYNDNELFCGGYTVQFQRNGGKCGVCGDAWHLPQPRPNEAGGVYGRGVISRKYSVGQVIKATVDITANHRGFFEFKLCPHNNPSTIVKQDCLDQYPLELADGSGSKYYPSAGTGPFSVQLMLPDHVSCTQCVFQWTYTAGNNWGRCENGTSKVGCGPQETFRGCADVAIGDVETNDIPTFNERPADKPSISAIPPRRPPGEPSYRPRPRPRPSRPTRPSYRPTASVRRRPNYNNAQTPSTQKPSVRRPRPRRPNFSNNVPSRRPNFSNNVPSRRPQSPPSRRPIHVPRPSSYGPSYTSRPTPYRPFNTKFAVTKKPRPTYKSKMQPKKTTNIEREDGGGGCRAVGVWASISGIGSWCDSNCARGYCPSSHCDCS